ncbi:hypothetical protein TPHA_0A04870 [Tetrapisispora phaffii CBS 4417]|uniref:Uncharacterized protein n=1 Tax=Tetrapisispora phaffii (strain ATCC 24235 / CBS 4417 / NBRC 1672 / NRRL Y-8282 / UCD 70-5) TaxID=1071381 RepID=G8BNT4_TETPH|nr:hypothetical protein TPHA_0A04870 [Tetrapisispora phaffii CBS 4417]CCE61562.1 hypothetical protein TPHA_0A04870 [Tetrapisispora phaffii CBS 4417]
MVTSQNLINTQNMTDISSNISTDCLASSPVKETVFNEADQQILEWAGKLELESVDLREKAGELTTVLKRNSDRLYSVMEQLNKNLKNIEHQSQTPADKDIDSEMLKILAKIEKTINDNLGKSNTTQGNRASRKRTRGSDDFELHNNIDSIVKNSIEKYSKSIVKPVRDNQTKITESLNFMNGMIFNFNNQLESVNKILGNMSSNLKSINDRQVHLENMFSQQKIANDDTNASIQQLQGTTLNNEIYEKVCYNKNSMMLEIPSTKIGAITRSKAAIVKRQETKTNRNIIPWDELNMNYSSEL